MKTLIISTLLIFSSFSYGLISDVHEYPLMRAELSETDVMGNVVAGSQKYILTLNMREELNTHASSFTLCQSSVSGELENCVVLWVTKPREQLRCNRVRYTAAPQAGNYPTLLLVDQSDPKSDCHQSGTPELWEVYLFSDKSLPTTLRGFPEAA